MNLEAKIISSIITFIALVAAIFGFGLYEYRQGAEHTKLIYDVAIQSQKIAANAVLAVETSKVHVRDEALNDLKNQQELKDADHQKTTLRLTDQLRTAAGTVKRLRDPNAPGCGGGGGYPASKATTGADSGAADRTDASGLLSAELTQLLQSDAQKADDINNAYASCRADSQAVRQ